MSFVKMMVHCVWSTKHRAPVLQKEGRVKLIRHIFEKAREKSIFIDSLDGYNDHLHALIDLKSSQSLADVMQAIKGESSFWANNVGRILSERLEWTEKYFAVSVGPSQVESVRRYIRSQEQHHKAASFEQECLVLNKKFGFKIEPSSR